MNACRACKHVSTDGYKEPHGFCRRFPPTVLAQNPTASTFPTVELDKFTCGEFSRSKPTARSMPKKASK